MVSELLKMWPGFSLVCMPGNGDKSKSGTQVDAGEETVTTEKVCKPSAALTDCCVGLDRFCRSVGCSPSTQIAVAVMRHGERLDAVDPVSWYRSEAGKAYPFDCPLSAHGRRQVGNVARELAQRCSGRFAYVVSSPYLRCVETAVEVCRALQLPICVDMQLGEVFGPACFGHWNPPGPMRRSPEEVVGFVPPDLHKFSPVDSIGQEPVWPESIEDARLRMVSRVEQYAEWAARLEGVNFVLVTHGDCVGACLTLALAKEDGSMDQVVDKVDYCGYTLLERTCEAGEPALGLLDEAADWRVKHGHVVLRNADMTSESDIYEDSSSIQEASARTQVRREKSVDSSPTILTSTVNLPRHGIVEKPGQNLKPRMSERDLDPDLESELDFANKENAGVSCSAWRHTSFAYGAVGI